MGTLPGPRLLPALPNPNELRISLCEMLSEYLVVTQKFRYAKSRLGEVARRPFRIAK